MVYCPFVARTCDQYCRMWVDEDCVIKTACIALIPIIKQVKERAVTQPTTYVGENELEIV